jgi:hypothetical protein
MSFLTRGSAPEPSCPAAENCPNRADGIRYDPGSTTRICPGPSQGLYAGRGCPFSPDSPRRSMNDDYSRTATAAQQRAATRAREMMAALVQRDQPVDCLGGGDPDLVSVPGPGLSKILVPKSLFVKMREAGLLP